MLELDLTCGTGTHLNMDPMQEILRSYTPSEQNLTCDWSRQETFTSHVRTGDPPRGTWIPCDIRFQLNNLCSPQIESDVSLHVPPFCRFLMMKPLFASSGVQIHCSTGMSGDMGFISLSKRESSPAQHKSHVPLLPVEQLMMSAQILTEYGYHIPHPVRNLSTPR